jgi:hypothetical protein
MADVPCPMCGKPNPDELEECQFCGARLKPVLASPTPNSGTIKPGQEPVKRKTSELEKINLDRGVSIRPGDVPTKKNTADLERALPAWLRSLREGNRPAVGESMAEPSAEDNPAKTPLAAPAPDSTVGQTEWLSGLSQAASEEEQVPDWLASLRGDKAVESAPAPAPEEDLSPGLSNADWMARLGNAPQTPASEPPAAGTNPAWEQPGPETPAEPAGVEDTPDWLKSLQSKPPTRQEPPGSEPPAEPAGVEYTPDWLKGLQSSDAQQPPAALQGADDLPEWRSGLPGISGQSSLGTGEAAKPAPAESTPDWLDQLKSKPVSPEPGTPGGGNEPVPDWLSGFNTADAAPTPAPADKIPDWLSNPEEKIGPASETPPAAFSSEPNFAANPPVETPGWLSQLQADVNAAQDAQQHKEDFEVVPAAPASPKETSPLPDWLSGIEPSTAALVGDGKDTAPDGQAQAAFSMETPEWLSQLNPEQAAEKPAGPTNEGQPETENLEAAELPTWVQAMRPVESVVESRTALVDESRIAEISGPLAGLRGVLPSGPGLGVLRKPPAYSAKLQVSDGQHRYATTLEKMITDESNPREIKTVRLPSNQLLRWLIAVLLFLAVGLPLLFGANTYGGQTAADAALASDKGAAAQIIDNLPANGLVLVTFDYDPALSGELEAVAAPLMDRLLSRGTPMAIISTSPTGPILAEHFLQSTPLIKDYKYQNGNQYINLGFLPGGLAGILYFADAPTEAVTVDMNGQPAWGAAPLQGIQKLSDFAAVIVMTDNADTGRNWIEQAGPHLGSTPMLMVISAQAEPMIRPYFDSKQIQGMVSGLPDARIYEQTNQNLGATHQFGLDNQYWASFGVGMLVAELLIVSGVILGLMTDWRARHKVSGGEA